MIIMKLDKTEKEDIEKCIKIYEDRKKHNTFSHETYKNYDSDYKKLNDYYAKQIKILKTELKMIN